MNWIRSRSTEAYPDWAPRVDEPLDCDCVKLLGLVEFCFCCFAWDAPVEGSTGVQLPLSYLLQVPLESFL